MPSPPDPSSFKIYDLAKRTVLLSSSERVSLLTFEKTFVLSKLHIVFNVFTTRLYWSSPRPISISQLNTLPHLHL